MDQRFTVDGNELTAHLARPAEWEDQAQPGVVIAHGFPAEVGGGINSTATFPALADRMADHGWVALAYAARGVAESEGDFSLAGWLADLRGAIAHLRATGEVDTVFLVGFGTGGALAIEAAAADKRVRGVATMGAPADFMDWSRNSRKLLVSARELGVIRDPEFPRSFDQWAAGLRSIKATEAAERLAPRELTVIHGSDDDSVPPLDARAIADAHGSADLRLVRSARHHLRHDPRAMAVLLGWLDRQRAALGGTPHD